MMTEEEVRGELQLRYIEIRCKVGGLEDGGYLHGFVEALEMVLGIDPKSELEAAVQEAENE